MCLRFEVETLLRAQAVQLAMLGTRVGQRILSLWLWGAQMQHGATWDSLNFWGALQKKYAWILEYMGTAPIDLLPTDCSNYIQTPKNHRKIVPVAFHVIAGLRGGTSRVARAWFLEWVNKMYPTYSKLGSACYWQPGIYWRVLKWLLEIACVWIELEIHQGPLQISFWPRQQFSWTFPWKNLTSLSRRRRGVGGVGCRRCRLLKTKIFCPETHWAAEEPDRTTYLVGFVPFAEQLNGRVQS